MGMGALECMTSGTQWNPPTVPARRPRYTQARRRPRPMAANTSAGRRKAAQASR